MHTRQTQDETSKQTFIIKTIYVGEKASTPSIGGCIRRSSDQYIILRLMSQNTKSCSSRQKGVGCSIQEEVLATNVRYIRLIAEPDTPYNAYGGPLDLPLENQIFPDQIRSTCTPKNGEIPGRKTLAVWWQNIIKYA